MDYRYRLPSQFWGNCAQAKFGAMKAVKSGKTV